MSEDISTLERLVLIRWGQSSNLGRYSWYQSRPLLVRCGSGTNQAEAGGHVTPRAKFPRAVHGPYFQWWYMVHNIGAMGNMDEPIPHRKERDSKTV